MASPKLEPLVLSGDERQVLEGWAGRRTAQQMVLRSRIVLACADGAAVTAVAGDLGVSRVTAAKWRSRFLRARLEGLSDEPRPGRPKRITPLQGSLGADRTSINSARHHVHPPPRDQPDPAHGRVKPHAMLAAERRDLLLARLRRDGKLVARDLAAELGLSEDSVRRDLRELAATGLCQRVYGGALPVSPALDTQAKRHKIAPESKRRVAAAAARLITPGSTVILDGGTTALEVVAALPPDLDATVITHSATTAAALADHPRLKVFMLGGQLHKQSVSASGAAAAEAASGITADLALLTINGVHPNEGLTTGEPEQAALTRILISRAAETCVMASIEKLGTVCACKITDVGAVGGIIADAPSDHPTIRQLRDQGASIIQA